MYIRRKLYSNINGEIVPINQTKLFSEEESNSVAKGAAKGAGVVAGTAGLGAASVKGAGDLHDLLKGKRETAIKEAEKANGKATRGMLGNKAAGAREAYEKTLAKNNAVINANKNAGSIEKTLGKAKNVEKKALDWLKAGGKNRKIGAGIAAAGILAGAGAGAGVSYLKGKKKEKVYSVLMTEEELALFSEIQKEFTDSYEDLNYGDLIKNLKDKNPLTIKKFRELNREHLSKEKGKGRGLSALRGTGVGAAGAINGAVRGAERGGARGAVAGAVGGAVLGTAIGYGADRAARRLRNKIRKSGGGGVIDDKFARESDRLAMLDGKMSKADFKKKWYRNDQAS